MKFKYGQIVKTPTGQFGKIHSYTPKFLWLKPYYHICIVQDLPDGRILVPFTPDAKFNEEDLTLWRSNSHIIKERLGIK